MAMPRTRSGRTTSLRDLDSRLSESERVEGAGSWDAIEWTKVDPVSRSVPQGVQQFLLEAEQVIVEGYGVVLVNTDEAGTLFVTNFRLLFLSDGARSIIGLGTIPLSTIEKFSKPKLSNFRRPPDHLIKLHLKDYFRQRYENHGLRFSSSDKTGSKAFLTNAKWKEIVGEIVRPDLEVTSSTPESTQNLSSGYEVLVRLVNLMMEMVILQRRAVYDALIRCARPARLWDLYAFAVGPSRFSNTNPRVRLLNEYFRLLGLGSHHASSITIEDGSFTLSNEWWRISSVNSNYTICPTYPFALLIPNSISDVDIQQACTFRARCRLPVISWCHPGTGAVLARSSQPLVGLMMNMRSNADEKLVAALWTQLAGSKERRRKLYIADARPRKNALANGAMGGGSESSANYSPSEIVFFGIDNIHAMRESLVRLRDYVDTHGANSSDGMSSFLVRIGFCCNKDLFARKELDRICPSLVKSDVSFRSVCSRSKSSKESEVGGVWK
ncbi:hypothetical protein OROHE_016336 [Orobanche hederae]